MFNDQFETFSNGSKSNNSVGSSTPSRQRRTYTHNPYSWNADPKTVIMNKQKKEITTTPAAVLGPVYDDDSSAAALAAQSSYASSSGSNSSNASFAATSNNSTTISNNNGDVHSMTLHKSLIGHVTFVKYPSTVEESSSLAAAEHGMLQADSSVDQISGESNFARLFLGQLPFFITSSQIQWIVSTFANGAFVKDMERITKKSRTPGGPRLPTGCLHCNVQRENLQMCCDRLHKKILIDDTGVWYASSPVEQQALDEYVRLLEADPRRRFADRPHKLVTCEVAHSSFYPSNPRWSVMRLRTSSS